MEKELRNIIKTTVNTLPEKCSIVFRLSRDQGFSNKKIAAELNISEKTVEAHLAKAIKDIRSVLAITLPPILIILLNQSGF